MLELPSRPSSSLDWNLENIDEKRIIAFDLGLEDTNFPIDHPMTFESLKLPLQKFTKEIWPQDAIQGVVLYRGTADFSKDFLWTEKQEQNFLEWKKGKEAPIEHLKRLFCADAFVHYFQMLSFYLPDELPIYLMLDANMDATPAEKHQILSKERFEHFNVALKNLPNTCEPIWEGDQILPSTRPTSAFCYPIEQNCSTQILAQIDEEFKNMRAPYRVIYEAFLNEQWDEVNELHVIKKAVSMHGNRKINGFKAAGGKVIYK